LCFALITIWIFAHESINAAAAAPTDDQKWAEDEFASVEDARAVEKQLRNISDKVAPAVVRLSGDRNGVMLPQGSGVVIDALGLILTHGHHNQAVGSVLEATFPDGLVVDAVIESVFSGMVRDFSLLKIRKAGQYPSVPLRTEQLPGAGERCFHFGYPNTLREVTTLLTPVLRLGRVSGTGESSTYANCLTVSGDSGGPLFDFEGRLIGIYHASIGPELSHPGQWPDISRILDGTSFLKDSHLDETRRMGFIDGKRKAIDTQRHLTNEHFPNLLAPARRATVEILVDGQVTILGTIVDPNGLVLTKRSEIMTHRGTLFGNLTCRLFGGEEVSAKAVADSHGDDVALLQLPKRGLTSAPLSAHIEPRRGAIVVAPIPGKDVSETGVVSVDRPLKIEPRPGSLTLPVENLGAGVTVTNAVRDLDRDGFSKLIRGSVNGGDLITDIDGEATPDLAAYGRQSKKDTFIAGDFVQLFVRRNGDTLKVAFPAAAENAAFTLTRHSYADVSLRLTGFPAVIIHDTIVGRRQCGGPLIDLEGQVVGVNIARFHRCSTFAIPQQRIKQLVQDLSNNRQ